MPKLVNMLGNVMSLPQQIVNPGQEIASQVKAVSDDGESVGSLVPLPADPPDRRERLSINLFDLDRIPSDVRGMLLSGRLDLKPIVVDKDHVDEVCVAFSCSLLAAACICDTVRSNDRKAGDYPTRVYLQKIGGESLWIKQSGTSLFTVFMKKDENDSGSVVLNPSIFPSPKAAVVLAEAVPPPMRRLTW